MMARLRACCESRAGVTLIELLVVVAILGILAAITTIAVKGTTQSGRGATKAQDEAIVDGAIQAYIAQHPQQRHPTLDGCIPNTDLDTAGRFLCVSGGDSTDTFSVSEVDLDIDVNKDGDKTDTAEEVVPITWDTYFIAGDGNKKFFTDFVDTPQHAFDLVGTKDGWKTGRTKAREGEDTDSIRSPFGTTAEFNECIGRADFTGEVVATETADGFITVLPPLDNIPILAASETVTLKPAATVLTRVTSSPTSGKYTINNTTGVITLGAALSTGDSIEADYTQQGETVETKCPVWVINANGESVALLTDGKY